MTLSTTRFPRRDFLSGSVSAATGLALGDHATFAFADRGEFAIGASTFDTTPPLGTQLAGFTRVPGKERRMTGIRQPATAHALVIRVNDVHAALISLDIMAVSREFTRGVQDRIAMEVGIPREHVHLCASHTHSMPTFISVRHTGEIAPQYMADVADRCVNAVRAAKEDLSSAEMYFGTSRAEGGNFNRTASSWKTEQEFSRDSTEKDRWLDSQLSMLRFERSSKPDVLWYHFSAHPVCFTDSEAGPDWIGGVSELIYRKLGVKPAYLQGHAGDVNAGDGTPWLGDPKEAAPAIAAAVERAVLASVRVRADQLRLSTAPFDAPYDLPLLERQIEQYRADPAKCTTGEWMNESFAKSWYADALQMKPKQKSRRTSLVAMALGDVGFLFHPTELYSYYGLRIRHDSPFDHTLVVGYADDMIGYLVDPKAYEANEYAAITAPRILGVAPFTRDAAQQLTTAAGKLLQKIGS